MNKFEALGLSAPIVRALEANEFFTPTPIQARAIPKILEGHDVIGLAQTGGGKTAAFVLPILEQLLSEGEKPKPSHPKALILAPTRELAQQITECVRIFSRETHLFQAAIYGGAPYGPQMKALRRGVDVLVATPGRLMDHIKRGNISLKDTPHFVLDEADKMLEMGFVEEVEKIVKMMPATKKTTMFSATINRKVEKLAERILTNPIRVEIERKDVVSSKVSHKVMFVDFPDKRELLSWLIERDQPQAMLIFTRTKSDADKLSESLRDEGHRVDALHGDKKQSVRERVLRKFRNGEIRILVATDVAARGIDVPTISHVVNMTLPKEIEGYVHRVGRTGRTNEMGFAYSFCDRQDRSQLRLIESYIKATIGIVEDHPFHDAHIALGQKGRFKGRRTNDRRPFKSKGRIARPKVDERDNVRSLTSWKEKARAKAPVTAHPKFKAPSKFTVRPKFKEREVEKNLDALIESNSRTEEPRRRKQKGKAKPQVQQRWEEGSKKKIRTATKKKSLKKAKRAALKALPTPQNKRRAAKRAKSNKSNGGSKIFRGRKAA